MSILTPPAPRPVNWTPDQLATVRQALGLPSTATGQALVEALGHQRTSTRQAIDQAIARVLAEVEAQARVDTPAPAVQADDGLEDPGDGDAKPKSSKRIGLAKLPRDWREKVFAATERTRQTKQPPSKLRRATALAWATGCRPDEIEKGCRVEMEDGKLIITIPGSKVGEVSVPNGAGERKKATRGIDKRILVIDPALHAGTRFLADLAASGPVEIQFEKNAFRSGLHGAAEKALGEKAVKRAGGVSPYSFRHAIGADLKSCDELTDIRRAAMMGHRSVESIAAYGRRRRGGSSGPAPVLGVRISKGQIPTGARPVGGPPGEAPAAERQHG